MERTLQVKLYAIGDLHLSGNPPAKPMTIFGEHWHERWHKIKESWLASVQDDDAVVLCGDTSWAMSLDNALPDLYEIADLPGKKIILRGNHDYWWNTVKKMTTVTDGRFFFLQNNFFAVGETAVCGTRGWNLPGSESFSVEDEAIYKRECLRLETSLQLATAAGFSDLVVALHYPPLYVSGETSGFADLCSKYKVRTCVFGHVHGEDAKNTFQGMEGATRYKLVAADGVDFKLQEI